jgi:hypothetical protein
MLHIHPSIHPSVHPSCKHRKIDQVTFVVPTRLITTPLLPTPELKAKYAASRQRVVVDSTHTVTHSGKRQILLLNVERSMPLFMRK